jgi:L-threonylcarbamoyladenylate synthase
MRVVEAKGGTAHAVAELAARVVQRGGAIIFPTDTVYGIGCDPFIGSAVKRIFALKNRPAHKPLSLHLASVEEMLEYAAGNAFARDLAESFLPGPLTTIVRRPPHIERAVTAGADTLGLRVPKHTLCTAILERCGPLAATSANLSGLPAYTGDSFATELPDADLFVDDGPTPLGAESTVVDVSGEVPRLVREGAISVVMLEHVLGRIERPQDPLRGPGR